jgi:outer membrane PBP1 activator LpoA protein
MLGCGSAAKHKPSEFAGARQNLQSIMQQANQAEPAQKHPLLLQAVSVLLANERDGKAIELLSHIEQNYLSPAQKDTFQLFYGEALLSTELSELVESRRASLTQLLSITKQSSHSIEWQIRYYQTLSDSYFANSNYLEAAKQRIDINDLIDSPIVLAENNDKIWLAIDQMSPQFLQQTITDFNSKRLNGWLEIVHINKTWGRQPDRLLAEMVLWNKRYPLHPAAVIKPKSLQNMVAMEDIEAKNIAILLPLSGRFSRSGKMVHDGIIAAHYQYGRSDQYGEPDELQELNDIPSIKFYDTAQSLSGLASYQQAINDGADFIIGPLRKESISQITALDTLETPFLFLNSTPDMPKRHQMVFQFVLQIEDEAIQAAHRAWEKGYRKAIAFIPEGNRGQRAVTAFGEYFEQLGGELIDTEKYQDISKISGNVQNLLGVDASITRKKRLEQILGRNIEFEMRRRQDADFIFLISKPKEARRIKPFINFYFALNLPVISISDIYSGLNNGKLDNDLNGIEFSDIPLYISQQQEFVDTRVALAEIDSSILNGSNGRLFSLGFDAYQIISQISKLRAFPDYRWYGLSGEIGIDEQGLVHRYLTWAKFTKGSTKVTKERIPLDPLSSSL